MSGTPGVWASLAPLVPGLALLTTCSSEPSGNTRPWGLTYSYTASSLELAQHGTWTVVPSRDPPWHRWAPLALGSSDLGLSPQDPGPPCSYGPARAFVPVSPATLALLPHSLQDPAWPCLLLQGALPASESLPPSTPGDTADR